MEKKILIVEDEVITAVEIQESLQKYGYVIPAVASSGEEAVNIIDNVQPDLILMDIVLKGEMDGIEAARFISEKNEIPVVFLTAYADVDTFNRAKSIAPYGYIKKPYEENNLRMTVELALFKREIEIASEKETMRLENEFLSNMSLELRTSLDSINFFIEFLYKDKIDLALPENKVRIKELLSDSHRLIELVDSVLELTEIELGKTEFFPSNVDLGKLIREVLDILPIEENGIETNIQIDPSLIPITIDPKKFKQVVYHYVSNAIKFSPHDDGKIDISARPEGEKLFRIEVKNNGIGIREEDIKNLFLPFRQLDMSMAKRDQGVGLGLALARRIVEAQGGQVGVNSAFGKGSTFFALLPLRP